jgi:hypothetical protein
MRTRFICLVFIVACTPLLAQPTHRHLVNFGCEGKPDRLVGQQNGTYFACIDGKVTCSLEGNIPQSWMDEHDAAMERLHARTADMKANIDQLQQEAKTLSPMERHERVLARARARREGRVIESTSSPTPVQVMTVNPAKVPSKSAPVERASIEALQLGVSEDEVLETIGLPKMKLAGGAGVKWTYKLTTGESAKLEFAGGKLARLGLP